jgi:hypothetical protein
VAYISCQMLRTASVLIYEINVVSHCYIKGRRITKRLDWLRVVTAI